MTREQKAAYVNAQAVCAMAEIQGMIAENNERAAQGKAYAYGVEDFQKVQEHYSISHNDVMGLYAQPDY